MAGGYICEICGNESDSMSPACPFCGTAGQMVRPQRKEVLYKVVNLEKGMPVVQQALARLQQEIEIASHTGYKVMIFIHGYGSSGKGGAIRREVRRKLQYLRDNDGINDFLPGEDCDKRTGRYRQILRRFPFLDTCCKSPNPGVTIVIL